MTEDLERLVDTDVDARVRQVMSSAFSDGPSAEAMRAAAVALGISAGASAATAAAASKPTLTLIVLKWLGIGAVAGLVASTAALSLSAPTSTARAPHPTTASVEPQASPQTGTTPTPPTAEALPTVPVPAPTASFAAEQPESDAEPAPSVATFDEAAPHDSLSGEIALLDRARKALRGGDSATALAELDRYDSGSSKHALAAEALLLRVRALVQAGRRGEARTLAERYVARHPGDGYSVKLRQLAGLPAPAPKPKPAPAPTPTPAPQGSVPSASF